MKLHFRTFGEGEPLIILHGVFGSSDNWQTLGKTFSEKFKVYLADLRNHGKSPHSDAFSYDLMVEDISKLMQNEGLTKTNMIGHSMGGKVAMAFATKFPKKIKKLVVVDIAPKYYPPHHQQIFEGFKSVKLDQIKSRKEADDQLSGVISNFGIRQFILKNLYRSSEGNFQWKLNIAAIEKAANEIGSNPNPSATFEGSSLFVAGSNSDYILESDRKAIQSAFPNSEFVTIEDAGHWVHAEKPSELKEAVLSFLQKEHH